MIVFVEFEKVEKIPKFLEILCKKLLDTKLQIFEFTFRGGTCCKVFGFKRLDLAVFGRKAPENGAECAIFENLTMFEKFFS